MRHQEQHLAVHCHTECRHRLRLKPCTGVCWLGQHVVVWEGLCLLLVLGYVVVHWRQSSTVQIALHRCLTQPPVIQQQIQIQTTFSRAPDHHSDMAGERFACLHPALHINSTATIQFISESADPVISLMAACSSALPQL